MGVVTLVNVREVIPAEWIEEFLRIERPVGADAATGVALWGKWQIDEFRIIKGLDKPHGR
jgi:hypothetical protein